jgi:non-homologous end joining protein Ku
MMHMPHARRSGGRPSGTTIAAIMAATGWRLAEHILDSKLAAIDPSAFRDRYEEALMAHLKTKQAGLPPQPKQGWAAPRRAFYNLR